MGYSERLGSHGFSDCHLGMVFNAERPLVFVVVGKWEREDACTKLKGNDHRPVLYFVSVEILKA